MNQGTVTFTEFAKSRGVSVEAVSKAVKVGRLAQSVMRGSGKHARLQPDLATEEWEANTDAAQQRIRPKSSQPTADRAERIEGGGSASTYQQARTLREAYMARLAKLEFEEKSGALVSADKVKNDAYRVGRQVRDGLLNIPDRIASELAAETDQFKIHARITEEIRRALEAINA